jgi:hypothetical protein
LPQQQNNKTGLVILAALVLVVLAVCLYAYIKTGDQDLETRFANAVGLPAPSGGGDNFSVFGFDVEGNNLSYIVILALLLVIAGALYVKYGK